MEILPPPSLLTQLKVPRKLLMGPGPSNCSQRILNACSYPMLGHMDHDFMKIMDEVKLGIKYAFQTNNEYTFAISGTGHCAMETAISNILEPGDTFLCASSGIWGSRACEIGRRIGAKCHQMQIECGKILHLEELEKMIYKIQPKLCFVCHGDSSTGVLQPLDKIGDIVHKYQSLLLVDCVASLGAAPLYMDKYGIDIMYSGSQKILNAPPGISPISFSPLALTAIKKRKSKVSSFYMDVLLIGNYWGCDEGPKIYHHTAPINLVYALREALSILASEKLEKSWERHKICAENLYENLEKIGLTLFISEKSYRLPSVTTVNIPANISDQAVIKFMNERFGIDIAGGLGQTKGKVWRIGLMGINCTKENIEKVSNAMAESLNYVKLYSNL